MVALLFHVLSAARAAVEAATLAYSSSTVTASSTFLMSR